MSIEILGQIHPMLRHELSVENFTRIQLVMVTRMRMIGKNKLKF